LENNRATDFGAAIRVSGHARVQLGNMTILADNLAPLGRGRSVYLDGTGSSVIYVLPAPRATQ
jgi:hypothetical protein